MRARVFCAAPAALLLALVSPRPAGALMSLRHGDAPPGFDLPDLAGKTTRLADLAGKPAVVLFIATWSPRSAEALEDFKRYHAAYARRGLAIVAIDTDGENLDAARQAAVREYVAAHAPPFPVLLDGRLEVYASWGVQTQPTEVVLDAAGRIAYVLPGYPETLRDELRDEIEKVLGIVPEAAPAAVAGRTAKPAALLHYNLARQLLEKGEPERALAEFRRSSAEDPAFLDAGVMAARVALSLGDPGPAEQLARQVSPEAVNRGDLRYLLGMLALQKGDLDTAEREFRGLAEKQPREGWGAWGLGLVALARGDRPAALASLTMARALQAENPEGEAWVGRWFRDRCRRQETAAEDDALVALFPALAEVREHYCRLFERRGDGGGK